MPRIGERFIFDLTWQQELGIVVGHPELHKDDCRWKYVACAPDKCECNQPPDGPPAPFEHLRRYLDDAVTQLLAEMKDQAVAYAVPGDDVVGLIKAVAARKDASPWDIWSTWDLRHQIPIEKLTAKAAGLKRNTGEDLSTDELAALRKRLRDRLGYTILGIILTETK